MIKKNFSSTYEYVVLYPDDVASSQVGRRQWRDVQLLVSPIVRLAGFDFAPVERGQLSRLCLYHSIFGHVLDRLKKTKTPEKKTVIRKKEPVEDKWSIRILYANKTNTTLNQMSARPRHRTLNVKGTASAA